MGSGTTVRANGTYKPTAGVTWDGRQIVTYLTEHDGLTLS